MSIDGGEDRCIKRIRRADLGPSVVIQGRVDWDRSPYNFVNEPYQPSLRDQIEQRKRRHEINLPIERIVECAIEIERARLDRKPCGTQQLAGVREQLAIVVDQTPDLTRR